MFLSITNIFEIFTIDSKIKNISYFIIKNYKSIQAQIKKNNFPLKNQFQKEFLNILKKNESAPKKKFL